MTTNPTEQFWEYLEPILTDLPGVAKVMLSDAERMDRLSAASRSEDIYPAIFVMRPRYRGEDANTGVYVWQFWATLYIFLTAPLDDDAAQDTAYTQAEGMAMTLLRRLNMDGKAYNAMFDMNSFEAEPVIYKTLDATFGYEIKFKFGLFANELVYH
jgi:hypothetical protein